MRGRIDCAGLSSCGGVALLSTRLRSVGFTSLACAESDKYCDREFVTRCMVGEFINDDEVMTVAGGDQAFATAEVRAGNAVRTLTEAMAAVLSVPQLPGVMLHLQLWSHRCAYPS